MSPDGCTLPVSDFTRSILSQSSRSKLALYSTKVLCICSRSIAACSLQLTFVLKTSIMLPQISVIVLQLALGLCMQIRVICATETGVYATS